MIRKVAKNTRKYKREKIPFLLKFQSSTTEKNPEVGNLGDISGGGLQFSTKSNIQVGEVIKVSILIPSVEDPIEAEAEVMRSVPLKKKPEFNNIGVKFVKMSEKSKKAFEQFIKGLEEQEKKFPFFVDLPQFTLRKGVS